MATNTPRPEILPGREQEARARLLKAAIVAFSEFGYEGASLRAIAEDAGVSFQLITYHFGSKDELWTAAVEEAYRRYVESGRSLGFDLSGDLREQFRNHLQLLLTLSLRNPHLRKILTQEYLARSVRYSRVLKPKLKEIRRILVAPYFEQVAKLGIVSRVSPAQLHMLWHSIVAANVLMPEEIELATGLAVDNPQSIEMQVDFVFSLVTQGVGPELLPDPKSARERKPAQLESSADAEDLGAEAAHLWGEQYSGLAASQLQRLRRLEVENEHLKQMVGELSLEKRMRDASKAPEPK